LKFILQSCSCQQQAVESRYKVGLKDLLGHDEFKLHMTSHQN